MKCMKMALLLLLVFLAAPLFAADFTVNYGEALQKAIYFFECQQSGPLSSWNRVTWKGDSCIDDSVPGGWYENGAHVKYTFPMAYSAAMLGWGIYESDDAIQSIDQLQILKYNLAFVCN